jgi:hypothetical protein
MAALARLLRNPGFSISGMADPGFRFAASGLHVFETPHSNLPCTREREHAADADWQRTT